MRASNIHRGASGIIIGAIVIIALFAVAGVGITQLTKDDVTITVKDKQTKLECSGSGSQRDCKDVYLIFTDKGTYKDVDSLLMLKFNSSDLYGQLDRGKTYDCKVNGIRIPFFSTYKNLLECKAARR